MEKARITHVLVTLAALAVSTAAQGEERMRETFDPLTLTEPRGVSVQLDNDLFSGAHRDQDYSWGVAVTFASPEGQRIAAPFDAVRARLESWLTPPRLAATGTLQQSHALQVGLLGMTPSTLRSADPLPDDRPYASLLFMSTAEMSVLEDIGRARFTSFTVGALGLKLAETLHRGVHKAVGNEVPLGWEHQIAAGGEPTFRYVHAEQWLLGHLDGEYANQPELKFTASGSAGYITEGSVAFSGRWGRIRTPWWSFAPELADYTVAPVAPRVERGASGLSEWFFFAGARLKARAYNALLQGQFRDSDVRVSSGDLARLQAEGWIGLSATWSDLRLTYTVRCASREMTREPGARSLIWAGVSVEKSF